LVRGLELGADLLEGILEGGCREDHQRGLLPVAGLAQGLSVTGAAAGGSAREQRRSGGCEQAASGSDATPSTHDDASLTDRSGILHTALYSADASGERLSGRRCGAVGWGAK